MKLRSAFGLLSLFVLVGNALACLNDRDSLEAEAAEIPDTIRVITGRFPRNPDLFYEMRLKRVTRELENNPQKLKLYDDAGVACDRLHRGDEAIAWMAKKQAATQRIAASGDADAKVLSTHRYRYLANLGTFHAHRWLRSGADRKQIDEMKKARDLIAAAIKLNPNAHFGREKYQLKVMDWIIHPRKLKKDDESLPSFLPASLQREEATETVIGLSGLITLGDAWKSVDVFNALANAVQADGRRSSVAYMAQLRCAEIIKQDGRSLVPNAPSGAKLTALIWGNYDVGKDLVPQPQDVEKQFATLRAEADAWQAQRTAFMERKFEAGLHPDITPNFWKDWNEPVAPKIYQPRDEERRKYFQIAAILGGTMLVSLLLLKVAHLKRK